MEKIQVIRKNFCYKPRFSAGYLFLTHPNALDESPKTLQIDMVSNIEQEIKSIILSLKET